MTEPARGADPRSMLHLWRALVVITVVVVTACGAEASPPSASPADQPVTAVSIGGTATSSSTAPRPTAAPGATATVTAPPPSSTTTASTTPPACLSPQWIRALPLRVRVGQLVMVQAVGSLDGATLADLAGQGVGGVLIGSGQESATGPGLTSLRTMVGLPVWIGVDQEGGDVARLQKITPPLPWPRDLADTTSPAQIEKLVAVHAQKLRAAGITIDFAPLVDVADASYANAKIGQRSFSNDPAVVASDARAFADGLHAANVMATLKHFPGHGRASGDTHVQAATTPPLSAMVGDLRPYRDLLRGPNPLPTDTTAVMVGHLDVPGLTDGGIPASLHPKAYALLRDDIGFRGVVFTDELSSMRAIADRMGVAEAVTTAIVAGADVAIWKDAGQLSPTLDALERAVASGVLTEDRVDASVARVLRAKQALGLNVC